ncbi:hypothetical protein ACQ4PT_025659 [Festuca glaucescens]
MNMNDVNGGGSGESADHERQATTVASRVPLYRMFAFVDRTGGALMAVGAASAVANGMAQPLMTFIFGDVIDAFGSAAGSSEDVLHKVTKVIINFVYLGIGAGLVSTLQVSCWTITGERQAARIRALYLKSILKQDIGFFDKDMSTGQVVERMSGDTFLIQDAIGEKVGMCIQLLSTFFGGFIIAFVRGWLLALVMLSSIPPVVVAGAIMSRMMTNLSSRMQAKYGDVGDIVEQTIGAIRTTVALVGESGSGKSTAIALLERFYDPNSGKILFDGVELQTLKVSWLRLQIGLVAQEPVLFNETIRANIAYGKQGEASEEEIVAAAEASNAHQFISGLPDGYDTVVGERGIQLSGGQKQRVAIARAILKDPKVLLLDEATSAMDAESERVVQEALDRVMVGRTTVVVAHRLSTVKGADIISVVKNGTIVEKGRHEELMRIKDGAYASLVELSAT